MTSYKDLVTIDPIDFDNQLDDFLKDLPEEKLKEITESWTTGYIMTAKEIEAILAKKETE